VTSGGRTTRFSLEGLETRPSQTWGGIRLVPLVRDEPIDELRLHRRVYGDDPTVVDVGDGTYYTSYVPHAFVATWAGEEDDASAAYGTRLLEREERGLLPSCMPVRMPRRMARRVSKNRLRFLPLHLAVEGYLALHFGGPEIAWEEWSRRAISSGMSPRVEEAYSGAYVRDLDDALRIFEIHLGQCGVLIYVADSLASAFVVPHPDDYRALHATLVEDLYGELIYQYGLLRPHVPPFGGRVDDASVRSLRDLRAQADRLQREWAGFHDEVMAARLFDGEGSFHLVQYLNECELYRFLPSFRLGQENHIGEAITVGRDEDARLAYLKTFRLSETQVRRGYLLSRLAEYDWHLGRTAEALGQDESALGLRLERAGFGYLLRQDVLDHYRAQARR